MSESMVERVAKRIGDELYGYVDPNDTAHTWAISIGLARAAIEAMASAAWQPIETAPQDGTVINVVGRYPEYTAGFPRYAAWREDLGGGWFEHSRFEPQRIIPWVWRPRDDWPQEPTT